MVVLIALLACTEPPAEPAACVPTATWAEADLALRSCRSCHGPTASPLSSPGDLLAAADVLPEVLADPSHGRATEGDAAALEAWLACPTDPESKPPTCVGTTWSGDAGPGDDPCAAGASRIEQMLTVGPLSPDLSCVCEVGGDVLLEADPDLPSLTRVGGDIRVAAGTARVDLPALVSAGGLDLGEASDLRVVRLARLEVLDSALLLRSPSLEEVDLPWLTELPALSATEAINLRRLELPRLQTVQGDLRLTGMPYLSVLSGVSTLTWIGGDLELVGLSSWSSGGSFALSHVGGDLMIQETGLSVIEGFDELVVVPGELSLTLNRQVTRIGGFDRLERVGEALRVSGCDDLERIDGFGAVSEIGLDGQVDDETHHLRIAFSFSLAEVDAFESLAHVGGVSVVGNEVLAAFDLPSLHTVDHELALRNTSATVLDGFEALQAVGSLEITGHGLLEELGGLGSLVEAETVVISENVLLQRIDGLRALERVAGDLDLQRNRDLADLGGLRSLATVEGDVILISSPSLSDEVVDELIARVAIGGEVLR